MISLIARYQVHYDRTQKVVDLVRRFVRNVRASEPRTLYQALQLDDEVSFLHAMTFPDEAAERAHQMASYTRDFERAIFDLCIDPPRYEKVRSIGDD